MKTADRVRETTLSGGVGAITLGGAQIGFRTWASAFADNDSVWYCIDDAAGNWEVGRGTYSAGTLTRNTVLASSNANALVNFGAGTVKSVFATVAAEGVVTTGTFATSVVTPLIQSPGNLLLQTPGGGTLQFSSGTGVVSCNSDNTTTFGSAALRWISVFALAIDSGTTGALSLKTNNGTEQLRIVNNSSAANVLAISGGPAGGNPPQIGVVGSDTNIGQDFYTKGSGGFRFVTNNFVDVQYEVLHTASATQHPTATGGNGVNSKIGTNAGGLDFTSATIRYPNIGTTAVAANATLNAVGSNDLLRSTSSRRYKAHIRDLRKGEEDAVLELRPRWFTSKSYYDDPTLWHLSFVAEEAAEVHPAFVIRGRESGEPENINDRAILALAIAKIQQLERRLAARKI